MVFTKKQVLKEVVQLQAGELLTSQSKVFKTWQNFATNWFQDDITDYLLNGFKGFYQRTPEQILLDFHFNCCVKGLSGKDVNKLMGKVGQCFQ